MNEVYASIKHTLHQTLFTSRIAKKGRNKNERDLPTNSVKKSEAIKENLRCFFLER